MDYEIVELEEKTVVGISGHTSNHDPRMNQIIGGLWQQFYAEGFHMNIKNRKNQNNIGLYSQYESDANGAYDITVCCEVEKVNEIPAGANFRKIPAGKYAKFIVKGNLHEAIGAFWAQLWKMNLDRKYTADFEEYQSNHEMENAEIHVYIAIL